MNCLKFLPCHSSLTSVQPGCNSELSSKMTLIKAMPGRRIAKDTWTELNLSTYSTCHQHSEHKTTLSSVTQFPHLDFRALPLSGFFRFFESSLLILFAGSSSSLCFHAGLPKESVFFFSPHCCFCSVAQSCVQAALGLHCRSRAFSSCGHWFHTVVVSLVVEEKVWHMGFRSCGTWAQQLLCMGLSASQPVGSSWTRDQTHIPYIDRRVVHWTTREVKNQSLNLSLILSTLPHMVILSNPMP